LQDFVRFNLMAGDNMAVGRIAARGDDGRIDSYAPILFSNESMGGSSIQSVRRFRVPAFSTCSCGT
jgi:hypothetical protein